MGPSGNGLVGADERRAKNLRDQGCSVKATPVRFQKAVSRLKENAAVERREARRSALWTGSSLPLEGQVRSQDGPTGAAFRARDFRRSASLFSGVRGFETDNLARQSAGMRRAATMPHGSTHGEETMPKFLHLTCVTLQRHARA